MNMLSTLPLEADPDPSDDGGFEWVERWLRADTDQAPPPGFSTRVMIYLEAEVRRVPPWRRALATIGMLLSGVLLIAWTAAQLFSQWHQMLQSTPMAALGIEALRGLALGLLSIGPSESPLAGRVALYGMAAAAMAILWFGATVAPRGFMVRATARRRP